MRGNHSNISRGYLFVFRTPLLTDSQGEKFMMSAAKADALIRDLADKLAKRLPSTSAGLNSLRVANDANGWPMLFISHNANEAEGQPVVLIRIQNVDLVSKDIFGNSSYAYAPHILQFAYELAAANKPEPTLADLLYCQFEAIKTGVRFQLYELANGIAVDEANLNTAVAAGPQADADELYWPTKLV